MNGPSAFYLVDNEKSNVEKLKAARSAFLSNRTDVLAKMNANQMSQEDKDLLGTVDLDTLPEVRSLLNGAITDAPFRVPTGWFTDTNLSAVLFLDYALHGASVVEDDGAACTAILESFNPSKSRTVAFVSQFNAGNEVATAGATPWIVNCASNINMNPNLMFCRGLAFWLKSNPGIDPEEAAKELMNMLAANPKKHPKANEVETCLSAAQKTCKPVLDLTGDMRTKCTKALCNERNSDPFSVQALLSMLLQAGWSVKKVGDFDQFNFIGGVPGAAILANLFHFLAAFDDKSRLLPSLEVQTTGEVLYVMKFRVNTDYVRFKEGLVTSDKADGAIPAFRRLLGVSLLPSSQVAVTSAIYSHYPSLAPMQSGSASTTCIWEQRLLHEMNDAKACAMVHIGKLPPKQATNVAPGGA